MALPLSGPPVPPADHFPAIVDALCDRGWIVIPDFFADVHWLPLLRRAGAIEGYGRAGIGRDDLHRTNRFVRNDRIYWLQSEEPADSFWLALMERLRLSLNRALFLGLFEFESHYARYRAGSFYKRHTDAFKGEGSRVVSVVLYLNPDWQSTDGGDFVIYPEDSPEGCRFPPRAGTLAVFFSEDFPHEVLPAKRTRYSVAGWFRVNGSTAQRADPPR